ncbi:MAG: efflux RND transporter periplasmic adaptor subunit [Chthoniobacter sp.]|nr:efflux RND transporter periplasmic adaptor subunit [Chthoniobacter sp.]
MYRPADSRPKFTGPNRLWPSLLLGLLAAFGLAACHSEKQVGAEPAEIKIEGDKISLPQGGPQQASLAVEEVKAVQKTVVHFTGRLIWDEEKTVRVFSSVGGRVDKINVAIGQSVAAGEPLATMFSADFGQAQADANKADADLKLSERTLMRLRDLFEHGAAAQKDVEAAEDDFENKRAEQQRAHARLKLYGVESGTVDGLFSLNAPLSGVVVEKSINPGQEVRPDQMLANDAKLVAPLFVISDPRRLSVQLDVTELDIANLKPGQPIEIHTRAYPDRVFEGRIEVIGQSLDPQTRAVKALGYVDNADGLLKAEMYVAVGVAESETKPAEATVSSSDPAKNRPAGPKVEIPVKAVFSKDNRNFVFVEKSPGNYERQSVEIGLEHSGRVCITDGLVAGERVVTEGSLQLQAMMEGSKD